jgi:hypothetical protein
MLKDYTAENCMLNVIRMLNLIETDCLLSNKILKVYRVFERALLLSNKDAKKCSQIGTGCVAKLIRMLKE